VVAGAPGPAITHTAKVKGKPGLQAYSEALRTAGVLTPQERQGRHIVGRCAERRGNGQFADLSRQRAALMADGVNLLMRQKGPVTTS
jgi:hypothetical protein